MGVGLGVGLPSSSSMMGFLTGFYLISSSISSLILSYGSSSENSSPKKINFPMGWGSSTNNDFLKTWGVRFLNNKNKYLFKFQIRHFIDLIVVSKARLVLNVLVAQVINHPLNNCVAAKHFGEICFGLWESLGVKWVDLLLDESQIVGVFLCWNLRNRTDILLHNEKNPSELSIW